MPKRSTKLKVVNEEIAQLFTEKYMATLKSTQKETNRLSIKYVYSFKNKRLLGGDQIIFDTIL